MGGPIMNQGQRVCKEKYKRCKVWGYHRGDRGEQSKRYRKKNPDKCRAHQAVYKAVKSGAIEKPGICAICGSGGRIVAHHEDYSRLLDVIFLCETCHYNLHKKGG